MNIPYWRSLKFLIHHNGLYICITIVAFVVIGFFKFFPGHKEKAEDTISSTRDLEPFSIMQKNGSMSTVEPGSFFSDGRKSKNAVALTFDDGPGEFTTRILDLLDQHQIKATFFMNGDQVELRPETAKDVLKRGHEIAEHTYSHINFYAYEKKNGLEKTKEKIRSEMKRSKEIIEKTTGFSPRLCRMPHGFHQPWLREIAKEFSYVLVNWTFGEDWLPINEEKMTREYMHSVRSGSILLFHDGGRDRDKTLRILPKIIQHAKIQNLSFLTAGEIIQ